MKSKRAKKKEREHKIPGFKKGDLVLIAQHLDHFHRGDKYGFVAAVGPRFITVKLNKSKSKSKFHYCYLTNLDRDRPDFATQEA